MGAVTALSLGSECPGENWGAQEGDLGSLADRCCGFVPGCQPGGLIRIPHLAVLPPQ